MNFYFNILLLVLIRKVRRQMPVVFVSMPTANVDTAVASLLTTIGESILKTLHGHVGTSIATSTVK